MPKNELKPSNFFNPNTQLAELCLIACPGAENLAALIDKHLVCWAKEVGMEKDSFLIESDCPRFQNGDAKGLVKSSVRGTDVFLICDPGNHSLCYNLFGHENHMSPDDHFANRPWPDARTVSASSCPICMAAASTAEICGRALTVRWLCRSWRQWV